MSDTIAALQGAGTGPLVYRYSRAQSAGEGAFLACSFWMVSALHHLKRRSEEARQLMHELVGLSNDVGTFAEMIDSDTDAFLGNLPQGLSHLALIGAALDLDDTEARRVSPPQEWGIRAKV
jgi:GH15 family glucan-1,4-alpha-glucosidase